MKEFISIKSGDTYHLHYQFRYHYIEFMLCPVQEWTRLDSTSGIDYIDKNSPSGESMAYFDEDVSKYYFKGSICWRGVWESRIYFPNDEEFWGRELIDMAEVFKNNIMPWAKSVLEGGKYMNEEE
jgi:hypothetical protein